MKIGQLITGCKSSQTDLIHIKKDFRLTEHRSRGKEEAENVD